MYAVPIHLFSKSGVLMIFIVVTTLISTSCMFSVIGASSILYHDVFQTYIYVGLELSITYYLVILSNMINFKPLIAPYCSNSDIM